MMNTNKSKAASKVSINFHLNGPGNPGLGVFEYLGRSERRVILLSSREAGQNPLGNTEIGPGL